jgi:hypothetical protein
LQDCSDFSWLEQFLCYNIKDSIQRKYEKTLRTGGGFKQCFNDVLGFRLRFDEYPKKYPDYYRVVDLRNGKQIDDGYSAIHLYYQRDNKAYPIEVQLWCQEKTMSLISGVIDGLINMKNQNWKKLYDLYKQGKIRTEQEFINELRQERGETNA